MFMEQKSTELGEACRDKNLNKVRRLLNEENHNPSEPDWLQRTPLHWVAKTRFLEGLKLLLEKGADPVLKDAGQWTPLHEAARAGWAEGVRLLLEAESPIEPVLNKRDRDERTALHWATEARCDEVVRLLLEAGAEVSLQDRNGHTPLHRIVRHRGRGGVRYLLDHGANVSVEDSGGQTPLHCAAASGSEVAVRALLAAGADPLARDRDDQTPLHLASDGQSAESLRLLLHATADRAAERCRVQDRDGWTLLHRAARANSVPSVHTLLAAGVDPLLADNKGQTPMHMAVLFQKHAVLPHLLLNGAALAVADKEGSVLVDIIRPQHLNGRLNGAVMQSAYKRLQDGHNTLQLDDMTEANAERRRVLAKVKWEPALLTKLKDVWGLSPEALAWLWRPSKPDLDNRDTWCDIVHPVDAVLMRCLKEANQKDTAGELRTLLVAEKGRKPTWVAGWRQMEEAVRSQEEVSKRPRPSGAEEGAAAAAAASPGPAVRSKRPRHSEAQEIDNEARPEPSDEEDDEEEEHVKRYRMRSQPAGQALVLSDVDFGDPSLEKRAGRPYDEPAVRSLLETFGFEVDLQKSLSREEMLRKIQEFARWKKHADSDAAVLVVLTHDEGDGRGLPDTARIIRCFSERHAPALRGKPKWLLLQGGRSGKKNRAVSVPWRADGGGGEEEFADLFVTSVTMTEAGSYRDTPPDDRVVHLLCRQLDEHWHSLSLNQIHARVFKALEMGEETGVQAMEIVTRGWTKQLRFRKANVERPRFLSAPPAPARTPIKPTPDPRVQSLNPEPEVTPLLSPPAATSSPAPPPAPVPTQDATFWLKWMTAMLALVLAMLIGMLMGRAGPL